MPDIDPNNIPLPSFAQAKPGAEQSGWLGAILRAARPLLKVVVFAAALYYAAALVFPWIAAKLLVGAITSRFPLDPAVESAVHWVSLAFFAYYGFRIFRPSNYHYAVAWVIVVLCGAMGVNIVRQGSPSFPGAKTYYVITAHGPVYSDTPGVEPETHRPFQALTSEMRPLLYRMVHIDRIRIDPDHSTLFHPWSGEPLAFTARHGCEIEFYSAPGYDVRTRQWLEPVTPEIFAEYEAHKRSGTCPAPVATNHK